MDTLMHRSHQSFPKKNKWSNFSRLLLPHFCLLARTTRLIYSSCCFISLYSFFTIFICSLAMCARVCVRAYMWDRHANVCNRALRITLRVCHVWSRCMCARGRCACTSPHLDRDMTKKTALNAPFAPGKQSETSRSKSPQVAPKVARSGRMCVF